MNLAVSIASLVFAMGIAIWTMAREPRRMANVALVLGMFMLGFESLLRALSATSVIPSEMAFWGEWSMVAQAAASASWLVFCMSFASGASTVSPKLKMLVVWGGVAGVSLAVFSVKQHVLAAGTDPESGDVILRLGNSGSIIKAAALATSVFALLHLERTFRASVGMIRWRIKFMAVGVGLLLCARIYFSSQGIIRGTLNAGQGLAHDGIIILACILVFRSLLRSGLRQMEIYPSQAVIRSSLTLLIAGVYLVMVGVLTKILGTYGGALGVRYQTLAFMALLAVFAVLLLSDRLQQRLRYWVAQNFQRPQFDYRAVWTRFTERLSACSNREEVCRTTAKLISETFNALSVTIYLVEETNRHIAFGASTSIAEKEGQDRIGAVTGLDVLVERIPDLTEPQNIDADSGAWSEVARRLQPAGFEHGGGRFCVGLNAAARPLGLMIVGDRVGGVPFTLEESGMLKCIADQVAGNLFNFELSDRLARSREMEAFQTMSTFFVHDLKNTAATLSLMLQNLPVHYDDPSFRQDALKTIGKTVGRLNELVARVGMLRQKTVIRPVETDVNQFIRSTIEQLQQAHQLPLEFNLQEVARASIDADQMQRVLTNLVLNAKDALGPDGKIWVGTSQREGWVSFSVRDNGCGMSREFLDRSLFRPFQTTKKKGIGIGMYHSRVIVEAHRGKFEVESEPGSGSTFRVLLPIKKENA